MMTDTLLDKLTDAGAADRAASRFLLGIVAKLPQSDPDQAYVDCLAEVLAAARAGEIPPADLPERIAAHRADAATLQDMRRLLLAAVAQLNSAADVADSNARPATLRHLNDRVHGLQVAVAEQMRSLGPARSAGAAMVAGDAAVAAWRKLSGLAEEYARIRQVQALTAAKAPGSMVVVTAQLLARIGLMRNVGQIWPHDAEPANAVSGWRRPEVPWPHVGNDPWAIRHDLEFLLWSVDAGAELWVPTGEQLQEAYEDSVRERRDRQVAAGPLPQRNEATILRSVGVRA